MWKIREWAQTKSEYLVYRISAQQEGFILISNAIDIMFIILLRTYDVLVEDFQWATSGRVSYQIQIPQLTKSPQFVKWRFEPTTRCDKCVVFILVPKWYWHAGVKRQKMTHRGFPFDSKSSQRVVFKRHRTDLVSDKPNATNIKVGR